MAAARHAGKRDGGTVAAVLSRPAVTAEADETLEQAARRMRDRNVGFLPVCRHGRIRGVLTDRDMVLRAVSRGLGSAARCGDVATPAVYACHEDSSLEEAASLMKQWGVRRLVVRDRAEQPVGVVSLSDLASRGAPRRAASVLAAMGSMPLARR